MRHPPATCQQSHKHRCQPNQLGLCIQPNNKEHHTTFTTQARARLGDKLCCSSACQQYSNTQPLPCTPKQTGGQHSPRQVSLCHPAHHTPCTPKIGWPDCSMARESKSIPAIPTTTFLLTCAAALVSISTLFWSTGSVCQPAAGLFCVLRTSAHFTSPTHGSPDRRRQPTQQLQVCGCRMSSPVLALTPPALLLLRGCLAAACSHLAAGTAVCCTPASTGGGLASCHAGHSTSDCDSTPSAHTAQRWATSSRCVLSLLPPAQHTKHAQQVPAPTVCLIVCLLPCYYCGCVTREKRDAFAALLQQLLGHQKMCGGSGSKKGADSQAPD